MLKRYINRYRVWRYSCSSPAERGRMLNEKYIGETKVGVGCEFYSKFPPFGSEPYLVEIGNYVRVTDGVKFCTHDGGLWVLRNLNLLENADKFGRIIIEDNVHIGWNAMIMPNVTIGHDSIVGCGAVVTKDVPPRSVVAGVPAKVICSIDSYYEKNCNKVDFTKKYTYSEKKKYLYEKFNLKDV